VDELIRHIVLLASEEGLELSNFQIMQYMYLADLSYAKENNGQSFTGATWIFDNNIWTPHEPEN